MNLAITTRQFNDANLFFQDPVRNTVMDRSNFVRVIYSDGLLALRGLCIIVSLPTVSRERYFNKMKCVLDTARAGETMEQLRVIERAILRRYAPAGKARVLRVSDQLETGCIKLFSDAAPTDQTDVYILKLSGVWETDAEYGLTHKFIGGSRKPVIRP